jgi:hypothetical protein
MSQMTIKVEVTGQFRSGTAAKSGKPYFMCEAFAHLPGVPYPQKFSFYASAQNEIPQVGTYECDVMASIKDDRINFEVDPRQGRRINTQRPAEALKAS